jgi:hypothetical protein
LIYEGGFIKVAGETSPDLKRLNPRHKRRDPKLDLSIANLISIGIDRKVAVPFWTIPFLIWDCGSGVHHVIETPMPSHADRRLWSHNHR